MAQDTTIAAEARTVHGSSAARRLRRAGLVPAVLATSDGKTELLQLNAHDFEREVARHSNPEFIAHVEIGGAVRTALVRELQRDGITGRISHADFGEIDPAKKIHVHVRLRLLGDPVGVRAENGVLEQQLRSVQVAVLPKDAIETLAIDVSGLHKGEDLKVRDLALDPAKFDVVDDADQVVANVAAVEVD
ncbi:MAG: 50S ribosomal protein L25, partial [Kiritimatiellae bacterium]|nr:50S ribosomal protein L25 [Kiritimatiellia bacterium]